MEINSEAKKVIYQYAEIVDSRSFDQLDLIMWSDFSMTYLEEFCTKTRDTLVLGIIMYLILTSYLI